MSDATQERPAGDALEGPRRRVQLTLTLGADDWESAAHAMRNLAHHLMRGECRQGTVSGGYDSGYVLTASEDESITHESWYAELQAYLAALHDNEARANHSEEEG